MTVKSGQAIAGIFYIVDGTGALKAADSTPTGTLYVAGDANSATVTITGTNPYKWAVTLPTLTVGQIVQVGITATVSGRNTGGVVFTDIADTKLVSDLNDIPAGTAMTLTAAYDKAKTCAQPGDAMTLTSDYDKAKTAAQPGDAMTLTPEYDKAKTAAQPGDEMALVDGAITAAKIAEGAIQASIEADSIADIADAVWDEPIADHVGAGTTGKILNTRTTLGSGAVNFTYTLTSSVDGSPIAQADVWVTTDSDGTNVIARGTTDDMGQVTFYLDPGTYYIWRAKSGWIFVNPDTEVVA